MNAKERVIAAMEMRPVDRPPVFPVVTAYLGSRVLGRPYRDMAQNPLLAYEGLRAMRARFGFDGFEVGLGPAKDAPSRNVITIDGIEYLADSIGTRPVARLEADDMPIPVPSEPILARKADLDKIVVTDSSHYLDAGCTDPVHELVMDVSEDAFIAGVAAGQTINSLVAWRGSEQALLDLSDDPTFVHEAMDRATDISIEIGKALIHAGVNGIYIGDAWASASIISPTMYEEFCLPYHRKACEAFHALGAKVYLHICGNCEPILELMAETGVDAIEPLDVDGGVDLRAVREKVGGRVCLKGGVSTLLLLNGSPEQVYAESRRCIETLGPEGYILGSADDIPRDTPFANIEAMVRAAQES